MATHNRTYRSPVQGNKIERAAKAVEWINTLESKYGNEVAEAIKSTTIILANQQFSPVITGYYANTDVKVFKTDVVSCAKAAITHSDGKVKVGLLNFASYYNPGGGFIKGSTAQEEALCYQTGLYPCLKNNQAWYNSHKREDIKKPYLHGDDCIWTDHCPLIVNGNIYGVSILTMAAPNASNGHAKECKEIMDERMDRVFRIMNTFNVDILILGAWGCGVFGADPKHIAQRWMELTKKYDGGFMEVVHPIIDEKTYKIFKEVCLKK